jgi:hypothetical protein
MNSLAREWASKDYMHTSPGAKTPIYGGNFLTKSIEIQVFPSPTGYMFITLFNCYQLFLSENIQ